jgi:Spy/CpxP family protein refolding chaperone
MGLWAGTASAEISSIMPPPMLYGMMEDRVHPGMMPDFPGMRPGPMMAGEHLLWRFLDALGLDEKQKKEIREMEDRLMKEMIRKRADMQVAKIELKTILNKDPVDIEAVETKIKRIEALKTEMHLSIIKAGEELKTRLTPDQRKKFKEMMEIGPKIRERGRMERMTDECLSMILETVQEMDFIRR